MTNMQVYFLFDDDDFIDDGVECCVRGSDDFFVREVKLRYGSWVEVDEVALCEWDLDFDFAFASLDDWPAEFDWDFLDGCVHVVMHGIDDAVLCIGDALGRLPCDYLLQRLRLE